ncbi:hypothetical protein PYW08_005169 [Mythimna loreyi]|uniref:Uncharacterized protein n=1 Tax=Mythimna loreyi TaxID=667449 RepID=A0ACC2QE91_9NEOP|nr:hypothetical protein PYW08_005169 [Mythimna loreyi]
MEHNLDDSLNLESAMGGMDFDHSEVVVHEDDISLETTGHEPDIPMEFENITDQQMLMDTGGEEITVSDFMNDQYTLQEYSVQDDSVPDTSVLDESHGLNVQGESMIDLQFESDIPHSITQEVTTHQPKYISVKAAPFRKKNETIVTSNPPRQVAIAPKPPKLVPAAPATFSTGKQYAIAPKPPKLVPAAPATFSTDKQYAIAPKPVAMVTNKNPSLVKKMSLASVLQSGMKSGNLLTQIGKQLVMVPAGSGQKLKLVTSSSGMQSVQYVHANTDQAELIKNVGANTQKPVQLAKVIMQGQPNLDSLGQPAVITKLMPSSSATTTQTRYVMQQKTVPISIASNKVLLASPGKQGVKFAKKQIIAIKSPTPKLVPVTSQSAPTTTTTKKVVITSNPSQNVILKTTAPPKTAQITKDGNVVIQGGQRSQLHQINVPGKGIQYIRLITNPSAAPQKIAAKAQTSTMPVPAKSFVLTDNKGNLIQMTAEKMISGQPPPLVLTGNTTAKMTTKPQKKLVRIAPVAMKPSQPVQQQQPSRSSQSLLAPLSPMAEPSLDEVSDLMESRTLTEDVEITLTESQVERGDEHSAERDSLGAHARESKAALRALIADTVAEHEHDAMHTMAEVEVDFERQETPVDDESSMDHDSSQRSDEHPLIVIPSGYGKQQNQLRDDYSNVEQENLPYLSPRQSSQALSESDLVSGDLGLRPRKACNCTKSQCLKLYCDCFANGEFCNRCNCNNCHNNLENEELRQKAIRACLDRNPNAFRPKIGKAKSGGPDIIRRHNKGCNCKRSGCLKNYCECYEAKIACTAMCKCVGCRNVEETLERRRDAMRLRDKLADPLFRPPPVGQVKQPCSFMTSEVIEAVCQCLLAAGAEGAEGEGEGEARADSDPLRDVIEEFARCLQDIISASHHSSDLDGPA